jgi:hypothetical protein
VPSIFFLLKLWMRFLYFNFWGLKTIFYIVKVRRNSQRAFHLFLEPFLGACPEGIHHCFLCLSDGFCLEQLVSHLACIASFGLLLYATRNSWFDGEGQPTQLSSGAPFLAG